MKLQDARNKNLFLLREVKPYRQSKKLMSANEAKLFANLSELQSLSGYYIFPQIPYSAILKVDQQFRDLKASFEEINKLRADFVIVEKSNFLPKLVIELNDNTHFLDNRKARDTFVQSALDSCGVPLVVLQTKDIHQTEKLNLMLLKKLKE